MASVETEYAEQTAQGVRVRLPHALGAIMAVIGVGAIPELTRHPDRATVYVVVFVAELLVAIGALSLGKFLRSSRAVPQAVAVVLILTILATSYYIWVAGEAEQLALLVGGVAVGTMVILPWGGGPQSVVAAASIMAFGVGVGAGATVTVSLGILTMALISVASLSVVGALLLDRSRFALFRHARALSEANAALTREVDERQQAEAQIQVLNAELEIRVAERTAQLEAANGELEAFSYTVSHDLRAPLRAIDGFAEALLDEYATTLDAQGRRYLDRIRTGTRRMGQLIDALLTLARVSREEMTVDSVNLSDLACSIAADLQEGQLQRQVEFVIPPGLVVRGDAHLLRVALENLLGNAWKYTRENRTARIEFGNFEHNHRVEYFVRDDGAGFDMAHADKLFRAFQRLHTEHQFEGTGVGLATVRRIIVRHGGEVWAEAELGKGATVFFTLGEEPCSTRS